MACAIVLLRNIFQNQAPNVKVVNPNAANVRMNTLVIHTLLVQTPSRNYKQMDPAFSIARQGTTLIKQIVEVVRIQIAKFVQMEEQNAAFAKKVTFLIFQHINVSYHVQQALVQLIQPILMT